jgi:hypothetical protein
MAPDEKRIMYCVVADEGTYYTRNRANIIPYLQKMWLNNAGIFEIQDGNIPVYLGNEKTYLNSLAD